MSNFPPPYFQINHTIYSDLITYMIYQNGKLYISHPDKNIALNIPHNSLLNFFKTTENSIQNHLQKEFQTIQILSFEFLAKLQNLKPKKVRTTFLPEAVFLIPTTKTTPEEGTINLLNTEDHITFPPNLERQYLPPFTPDKNHFINQIKQLQKRSQNKTTFNQKFIQDNNQQEEVLLQNLQKNSPKNLESFLLKTPDFSLLGNTKKSSQIELPEKHIQPNLKLESHHRNFQKGSIIIKSPLQEKEDIYTIDTSIESIQNNLYTNITQNVKPTSKQFDIYKKAISKNKSLLKLLQT